MCVNLYLEWKLRSREEKEEKKVKNVNCERKHADECSFHLCGDDMCLCCRVHFYFPYFLNEVFRSPSNHESLTIQLIRRARGRVRTLHESRAFNHWLVRYYWNIKIHVINKNNIIESRRHAANRFTQSPRITMKIFRGRSCTLVFVPKIDQTVSRAYF